MKNKGKFIKLGNFLAGRQTSKDKFSIDCLLEGAEKNGILSNLSISKYENIESLIAYIEENLEVDFPNSNEFWNDEMINKVKEYKEKYCDMHGINDNGEDDFDEDDFSEFDDFLACGLVGRREAFFEKFYGNNIIFGRLLIPEFDYNEVREKICMKEFNFNGKVKEETLKMYETLYGEKLTNIQGLYKFVFGEDSDTALEALIIELKNKIVSRIKKGDFLVETKDDFGVKTLEINEKKINNILNDENYIEGNYNEFEKFYIDKGEEGAGELIELLDKEFKRIEKDFKDILNELYKEFDAEDYAKLSTWREEGNSLQGIVEMCNEEKLERLGLENPKIFVEGREIEKVFKRISGRLKVSGRIQDNETLINNVIKNLRKPYKHAIVYKEVKNGNFEVKLDLKKAHDKDDSFFLGRIYTLKEGEYSGEGDFDLDGFIEEFQTESIEDSFKLVKETILLYETIIDRIK